MLSRVKMMRDISVILTRQQISRRKQFIVRAVCSTDRIRTLNLVANESRLRNRDLCVGSIVVVVVVLFISLYLAKI